MEGSALQQAKAASNLLRHHAICSTQCFIAKLEGQTFATHTLGKCAKIRALRKYSSAHPIQLLELLSSW
jgi:hypothetical protein